MTWRWPRIRVRPALTLLALFAGVGLAQGVMVRLVYSLRGGNPDHPVILFQLTGAISAWAAVPVVQAVVLNTRSFSGRGEHGAKVRWLGLAAFHLAGYFVFAAAHFVILRSMREALLLLSVVSVSDGALMGRVLWEMQNDLIVYASTAGFLTVLQAWQERDQSAVRMAELETRLAEARLAALSAQVDPHFLYNALNTIGAVMYEDLPKTERLLGNLGSIMRATLRDGSATWSLGEEREHTERYVELLSARFGDRLNVEWHQAAGVSAVQVPRFAIQTLIENAVKHNQARLEVLNVRVELTQSNGNVAIVVEDDGAGFVVREESAGKGLARLEQTLRLLHGENGELERASGERGGARVRLRVPAAAS